MPKKCRECLLCEPYKTYNDGTENEFCIPTGKPLVEGETPQDPKGEGRSCPLVELPEKHGDLIDRNKLLFDIEEFHLSDGKFQHWVEVQNAIVEAEGEK